MIEDIYFVGYYCGHRRNVAMYSDLASAILGAQELTSLERQKDSRRVYTVERHVLINYTKCAVHR